VPVTRATTSVGWAPRPAGQALVFGALFRPVLADVPHHHAGVGGGVLVTIQQSGLALGVATLGTLYLGLETHDIPQAFAAATTAQIAIMGRPRDGQPNDAWVSPLDFPREDLRLCGTKKGCNEGAGGACTVLVECERILSCLSLAAQYQRRRSRRSRRSAIARWFTRCSSPPSTTTGCRSRLIGGRLSIGERTARPVL
jgi:hypothetical protein